MRKTLIALTAAAGLLGAWFATTAHAAPVDGSPLFTTVQFYEGGDGPRFADWREREWRHREWERHRRWEEARRWHEWHHGW